jgi:hypothetical protein
MANYDGLTRNAWPGTWSPSANHPIVLDTELRGSLRFVSGQSGDQLSDITGQRLQDGMLVYVANSYGIYTGGEYYKYSVLEGETRNPNTGELPNNPENWSNYSVTSTLKQVSVNLGSAGSPSTIDTFNAAEFRTIKYVIQLEKDSDNKYHSAEILLTHNGADAYFTEYALVYTDSSLGEFDANIDAGNVSLTVIPSYDNITFKAKRISVDA